MLFLYLKSIVMPTKKLFSRNWPHFIIPILYILFISIPLLISMWNKEPVFDYIMIGEDYFSLAINYSLIYCIISLNLLKKAETIVENNYSNTQGVDLKWIKKLLIGATVVISIDVLSTLYELLIMELTWNTFYLTAIGVVILIGYLAYNGLTQSKVLLPMFLLNDCLILEENEAKVSSIENQKSIKYSDSEINQLNKLLDDIMKKEKSYLNEDLSLGSLALLLETTDKKISYLLNQHKKISFYDYINGYRVEEVKLKMENHFYDKYTLLAIAFECGFNSKSSFNRIFKKIAKVSPSEYKKQLKIKAK